MLIILVFLSYDTFYKTRIYKFIIMVIYIYWIIFLIIEYVYFYVLVYFCLLSQKQSIIPTKQKNSE